MDIREYLEELFETAEYLDGVPPEDIYQIGWDVNVLDPNEAFEYNKHDLYELIFVRCYKREKMKDLRAILESYFYGNIIY